MKAIISHDGIWPDRWRWRLEPSTADLPPGGYRWDLLKTPSGSAVTRARAERKARRAADRWRREIARREETLEVDV